MQQLIKILFLLSIIFSSGFIRGQSMETVRLEVPAELDVESYHVESLSKYGVLIFYESNELSQDKKRKWYFGHFDTSLNQQWLKFVELENKIQYHASANTANKIHLLFKSNSKGRNESGVYEIVSLDLRNMTFEQISGTFPAKAEISNFEVIGDIACMGINLRKSETDLLFIDLNTGSINPMKLAADYESYIETVYGNKRDKNFYVALKVKQDNRYIRDYIHIINSKGKTIKVKEIKPENNLKILRKFQFVNVKNNQVAVFGIYDFQTGRVPDFNEIEDEDNPRSAGLFYFSLASDTINNIKYVDFIDLDNIHGSISQRNVSKVKNTDESLPSSGAEKMVTAFYNINKPQIIYDENEGFVFSAEVYKPHYRTETRMDYDFYGRPYPYTYSVFAGYLFFDVIVVALTEDGNIKWNNDFIIRDLKSFSLDRHTYVFKDGEFVTAAYVNGGKIYSQLFDGVLDVESDETSIATNHIKDRVIEDENNHIIPWFDNYFLIYGYQKINNRTSRKTERVTFYLNKIAYK